MRRFLLAVLLLLLPLQSFAAIARDSVDSGANASGTSVDVSHTITGSNTILIACVWEDDKTKTITPTFNGTSMTLVDTAAPNSSRYSSYILVNPASGTHNIHVAFSGSVSYSVIGASYTGAKQTGQPDSHAGNAQFGVSSLSVTPTIVSTGAWAIGCGRGLGSPSFSAGPTNTLGGAGQLIIADSNGTIPSGSYTSTFTAADFGESSNLTTAIATAASAVVSFGDFIYFN